ncbi:MAG: alpha/beta hydrolase [Pseudoxanthomonas suwonensis]|nr:alpha/beta hydrolase [Pseudoxanthomonas suwonensis]
MGASVLVLHGLWMHSPAMAWFARQLRANGFDAHTLGYYSVMENTDKAVGRVREALAARPGSHVVAHSMGGLMTLRAIEDMPPGSVGRVVCLGTPLAGSRAADGFNRRVRGGGRMIGQHLDLLLAGAGSVPVGVEVGEIAGCRPLGLGGLVARFDCPHDGTVAVGETRIPGLRDHIVIEASHGGLMFSAEAVRQSVRFLRDGCFDHAGTGEARRAIA